MDSSRRKELKNAYKTKPVVGAVYCIRCSGNGRVWMLATKDIEGIKNRFSFAIKMKGSPDPSMNVEWSKYGSESFSLEVLEELNKGEIQTDREFSDDIDALYELWLEKSQQGE